MTTTAHTPSKTPGPFSEVSVSGQRYYSPGQERAGIPLGALLVIFK